MANQPITWQQLNAFRHLDVVKTTCRSSNRASEWGRKRYLSDFECGMVVGATRAGLNISKTADLLWFSHTIISRVYREWSIFFFNIQWAAVVWMKMPCWCQTLEENGQTGWRWQKGNSNSNNVSGYVCNHGSPSGERDTASPRGRYGERLQRDSCLKIHM